MQECSKQYIGKQICTQGSMLARVQGRGALHVCMRGRAGERDLGMCEHVWVQRWRRML
jgi:hypothetical protein